MAGSDSQGAPTVAGSAPAERLESHRDAILGYLRGMVRDPAEAEDLTQEALLRAHAKLGSLRNPGRLVPWLYRIATNVAHDRFRQVSSRPRAQPLEGDSGAPGREAAEIAADTEPRLDKVIEQREMSACVQGYIEALPESYRSVIFLHDLEGLTNPEIAEFLGLSVATVKIRLHRARARLREALREGCSFSVDERGVGVCDPKDRDP